MSFPAAILGAIKTARSAAGATVTYHRGASEVELQAALGQTEYELDDGSGVLVRYQSRDYLIAAADLVLDDARTLPQAGDKIRETVDDDTLVYEVMGPGHEPHYRYADPHRQILRIHTKHAATE